MRHRFGVASVWTIVQCLEHVYDVVPTALVRNSHFPFRSNYLIPLNTSDQRVEGVYAFCQPLLSFNSELLHFFVGLLFILYHRHVYRIIIVIIEMLRLRKLEN